MVVVEFKILHRNLPVGTKEKLQTTSFRVSILRMMIFHSRRKEHIAEMPAIANEMQQKGCRTSHLHSIGL